MSKLRTYQLQNPDSATVNIELDQSGGTTVSGILTASSGVVGNVTGNVTGTATTATNLADAANITTGTISNDRLPATITKNLTGNVTGNLTGNLESTASLVGISSSISDTAVDVFVYDTSKDSDGGAWRKRTQHTSWYNETLNTATRGSRREFPAVAVIVCESDTLTIYDGDDPDLPMWIVFTTTGSVAANAIVRSSGYNISTVSMLNGLLVCGVNYNGGFEINFVSDKCHRRNPSVYAFGGNVASRNGDISFITLNTTAVTVNTIVNDVAMTVLPNAPIDSATGLPVPTIAVATDGGVSVIKDDGTVVNVTASSSTYGESNDVDFTSDNKLITIWNNSGGGNYGWVYVIDIPTLDETLTVNSRDVGLSWFDTRYELAFSQDAWILSQRDSVNGEKLTDLVGESDSISAATSRGLTRLVEGSRPNGNNALVSYATTSYNTGWMHDNIRGAFLSDTDTTNITDANLITNGTFDTDLSGWSDPGSIASVSSGQVTLTSASGNPRIYQEFTVVPGKSYYFSLGTASGNASFYVSTNTVSSGSLTNVNGSVFTVPSGTTTVNVVLYVIGTGNTATYDNIVVKLADPDRSVNNQATNNNGKGLGVFGTVTKSAVATGAELVGYSGNGSTDYLEQPYNSDLDFGANTDFSVMGWMYNTSVGGGQLIFDRSVTHNSSRDWQLWVAADLKYMAMYIAGGSYVTATNSFPNNTWFHFAAVRTGGRLKIYIDTVEKLDQASTASAIPASNVPMKVLYNCNSNTKLALLRFSASAPSPEQIKKIYEDEKVLFQENAACTLYGSSDAVTALAYDEDYDTLYVGTSSGRSDFRGLRRINNTTTAVTTAISASNGLVAEQ